VVDQIIQKGDLVFRLSPTQEKFVYSDAHVCLFVGPMGEGKTWAGVAGVIAHAARCGRPIRGALIRDTHQNIKISTAPDIIEMLGNKVKFMDDYKKMIIHSNPRVEIDCFGIDDAASLSKLQGPQYAVIWLEEPAPIEERANAGLPRSVFELAIARASRQAGTVLRVQITQNPADEDHWTEELAHEPRVMERDPDTGAEIIKEVFRIPYGENTKLNALSRAANRAAFKNDPGKFARYVQGVAAPVQKGKKVTPEYNRDIHLAKNELPIVPGAVGIRGYDGWHDPVCIIAQLIPPGKLWFHAVLTGDGIGIKQLIEQQVLPLLQTPKYKETALDWRDMGDPTMATPDQSNTQVSAAKEINELLKTRFEKGATRWPQRINPVKTGLTTLCTDGTPQILISPTAWPLHRALNGGWHFKTDNSGNIIGTLPAKNNVFDHIGNCFAYIVSTVFSFRAKKNLKYSQASRIAKQKRFASSYGGRRPGQAAMGGRR